MVDYKHNLLHIHSTELSTKIYRVFPIQRLLELFRSERNTLVRPKLWDDPFENFVLRTLYDVDGGTSVRISFKEQLYGQCWSTVKDSDALWRIYSPDKNGVRVRSTIERTFNSLWSTCPNDFRELSCFIGKVQYLPQKTILGHLDSSALAAAVLDNTGQGKASTLLLKRREFKHESEVRLIYFNHDEGYSLDIFQYELDPNSVFDELTFDPRLSDELFEVYSAHFQRAGFSGKINRSPLYRVPDLKASLQTL